MELEGGGWTVVQRRNRDAEHEDFSGNWTQYKFGFGERVRGEFWLGNYNIHKMANPCQPNELAITIHRKTQYAMEEFVSSTRISILENEDKSVQAV